MPIPNLPIHEPLSVRSRLRTAAPPRDQIRAWEWAWLVAMGAIAASAATFWDWSLGIPGHAILRIVFPMTLGVAMVPRRGAGLVMCGSAMTTTAVFSAAGHVTPGTGAMTSLAAFGPCLDLALSGARRGGTLLAAFAGAGLASNLLALAARGGSRLAGHGGGGGTGGGLGGGRLRRALGESWWQKAPLTYVVCGLLAGVLCALIWFALQPRSAKREGPDS